MADLVRSISRWISYSVELPWEEIVDIAKRIFCLCVLLIVQGLPALAQPSGCSAGSCAPQTSASRLWRPASLPEPNPGAGTLRAAAAKIGLYIGTMVDPTGDGFDSDAVWFRNILLTEFNLMEPGNQLKWPFIEPAQGNFNFAPADHLLDYAVANGLKVRGHTLLWGVGNPAWLYNGAVNPATNFTAAQLEEILVDHIRKVVGHFKEKYPGAITTWDVTNEIMGWNNRFNADGIVWTKIGANPDKADYVRIAFRTARAVDPDAILCMTDWDNDGTVSRGMQNGVDRTANMIAAVRALKAEGVPIDCVGMQAHNATATYAQILAAMRAYADMGVQVHVTEWDQTMPASDPNSISDTAARVTTYLQACVDSRNCTMFNIWGFTQKYPALHYGESRGNTDLPTMFPWDATGSKTAIYAAMLNVLRTARQ
jgi:endo-1,4-beta-xylanase